MEDKRTPIQPVWEVESRTKENAPSVVSFVGSAPSPPAVDDGSSDYDSAVSGMSVRSSTASLRPSIYDHIEENGRTYHRYKQGQYLLPNDEQEQERLDLQHELFKISFKGQLHLAPIGPDPHNVLDIGTGTGIWAIEFAQQYPSAQVLGTDLSAIQPTLVPPNCRFEIDDAEDEWVFSDKFDYIHGRALLSCFKDPSTVLKSAYNALTPGGTLELQDGLFPLRYIGDPPTSSDLYKWSEVVVAGAAKSGRPWTNAQHYKYWMEELGFEDIVQKHFYWPTNSWAKGEYFKRVAAYFQEDLLGGIEAISFKVMGVAGWSVDEIKEFLPGVKKDFKDPSIHAYMPIVVVYGRKPLSTSEMQS